MALPEIDVNTLRAELDGPTPPTVIDVREAEELAVSRMHDDVLHIPLGELPDRVASLDPGTSYVVLCHHGARSARATAFLLDQGFQRVRNIAGGIDAYAREVDPSLEVC